MGEGTKAENNDKDLAGISNNADQVWRSETETLSKSKAGSVTK